MDFTLSWFVFADFDPCRDLRDAERHRRSGAWAAVPWNPLFRDIPGVLIGGQIGPRLQGRISPHTMRRAISILFVLLAAAMMSVALRKSGAV